MANVKSIIAAHLSQRQRTINRQVERADLLGEDRLPCNIIRVATNINVPGRPGFVWCQEYSPSDDTSPFHAFNDKVQAREGLSVWIGPGLGGRREVLDWNNATIVNTADYAAQKYLPTHHTDHEWPDFKPGPDVVNVYPRSLSMLRTYPGEAGALTVSASPLRYIKSNALILFPGKNSLDISASQPASGLARFVGIYLDPDDNTLKSVNGATTGDSPAITPDSPAFPESAILSANVRLNGDQTTFSEVDIVDTRQILDSSGAIDGTRVSKLVSPDGLTDPVLSADNSGDVTLAGTGALIVPVDIQHAGDPDTKWTFDTDKFTTTIGSLVALQMTNTTQDLVEIGDVAGTGDWDINFNAGQMFLRGSDGFLGVGNAAPVSEVEITGLLTVGKDPASLSSNQAGAVKAETTATQTASDNKFLAAIWAVPAIDGAQNNTALVGIRAFFVQPSYTGTATVTGVAGFDVQPAISTAGTITNTYGLYSRQPLVSGGGAITNAYGLYVQSITAATTNWAVYSDGSTPWHLGGYVEFDEMTAPAAGAANTTRLYAEDSGGTTRQQIVFNGGNTVTIAQDGGLQTYTPTNVVTDRSYDANATSVAELADTLGTLIADFQAAGILG